MLTNAESILEYDDASRRVRPDRLLRQTHGHYLDYAERMLACYARGVGQTRRELHRGIESICATLEDCPLRRVRAFCKLLDEVSVYDTDRRGGAAKLRRQVFLLAAPLHPLVTQAEGLFATTEADAKRRIAAELGMTWEQIDHRLFADVIEFQRLDRFDGYPDAAAFLARYNVAQTQAALYRAERLSVWSRTDHKSIIRYAKLARLMHDIERQRNGSYLFRFDGPASILRRSTRYGVAMARLVPGLLSCRDWHAVAKLHGPRGRRYALEFSSEDGLRSPVVGASDFDSDLEADFFASWGDAPRDGWKLEREPELLHHGQTVFTPDFALVHQDGRRVLLEIIGYWTPEYLLSKAQVLTRFRSSNLIIAIDHNASFTVPADCGEPILFRKRLKPEDVLARL